MSAQRQRLVSEVKASIPIIDHARTPQERQALKLYRQANDADKKRLLKLACAGVAGKLPSVEESRTMTLEQVRAFADNLPETFA